MLLGCLLQPADGGAEDAEESKGGDGDKAAQEELKADPAMVNKSKFN